MEENNREEPTPEEIAEMFEYLISEGYIEVIGETVSGEPLYKFSRELMEIPEFMEVHQAITNDLLFNIWNKGFIEMNPMNEDGDWNVRLNAKSQRIDLAMEELDEDEFVLFLQVFQELKDVVE